MSVATLPRASVVEATLSFGLSVPDDLAVMRYLRDATSNAIRLRWTLDGIPLLPLESHVHLIRPSGGVGATSSAYAQNWADGYRYGSFYYRQGPGFVTIKDVRPDRDANRMVISDGADDFLSMVDAETVGELSTGARDVLDDAVDAGLVVRAGDHLLVLPYRLRHWPVPYIAA